MGRVLQFQETHDFTKSDKIATVGHVKSTADVKDGRHLMRRIDVTFKDGVTKVAQVQAVSLEPGQQAVLQADMEGLQSAQKLDFERLLQAYFTKPIPIPKPSETTH